MVKKHVVAKRVELDDIMTEHLFSNGTYEDQDSEVAYIGIHIRKLRFLLNDASPAVRIQDEFVSGSVHEFKQRIAKIEEMWKNEKRWDELPKESHLAIKKEYRTKIRDLVVDMATIVQGWMKHKNSVISITGSRLFPRLKGFLEDFTSRKNA